MKIQSASKSRLKLDKPHTSTSIQNVTEIFIHEIIIRVKIKSLRFLLNQTLDNNCKSHKIFNKVKLYDITEYAMIGNNTKNIM